MDDKAKKYKKVIKQNAKKQGIPMKKPGAVLPLAGPSIKPKNKEANAKAPMFKSKGKK